MNRLLYCLSVYNFLFPIRLVYIDKSEWIFLSFPLIYLGLNSDKSLRFLKNKRYKDTFYIAIILLSLGLISSMLYSGD